MKKFILTLALTLAVLSASANEVRYFTKHQASRVAMTLDAQNELMIYCGYEYELATYVIINEIWYEPVNSKYYEIWLFGYDAYTGEEIYMPLDLGCVWLFNASGSRIYSAAQYLRFRSSVSAPNFYWTMPPYNPFTRHYHDPAFNRIYTYHYEVHRYGWRPPIHQPGHPAPLPSYYMRTPSTPAVVPTHPYTPGVDYPRTPDGHGYLGSGRNTTGTRNSGIGTNGGARTGSASRNNGNPGTTNRSGNNSSNTGRGDNTGNNNSGRGVNSGNNGRGESTGTNNSGRGVNGGNNGRGESTGTNNSGRGVNGGSNGRGESTGTNNSGRGSNTGTSSNGRGESSGTGSSSRGTTARQSSDNGRGTTTATPSTRSSSTPNRSTSQGSSSSSRESTGTNRSSSSKTSRDGKVNTGSSSRR